MYGALATYKFGGFGVLGYITQQQENYHNSQAAHKHQVKNGVFWRQDSLLPYETPQTNGSTLGETQKMQDSPIPDELSVYYLEDMEPDKGKTGESKGMASDQLAQNDVDTVGWID
uniref:Uncharacterized protein n=1 Tax=Ditylenchus dipsaci TaxID=166011 RepID=A0A915D0Z1_9BILA